MLRNVALAVVLLAAAGCGNAPDACHWPASAQTASDASPDGCTATPRFDSCEVADDGSQRCHDECKSSEYALSCTRAVADDALGCRILPIPTPMDVTIYCCPCSR